MTEIELRGQAAVSGLLTGIGLCALFLGLAVPGVRPVAPIALLCAIAGAALFVATTRAKAA